jgi:hypothetical protein
LRAAQAPLQPSQPEHHCELLLVRSHTDCTPGRASVQSRAPMEDDNDSGEHHSHPEEKKPVDIVAIEEAIQSAIERGTLIQLARDSEVHGFWEGFPLVVSNNLLLMRTVLDFRIDGFSVVSLSDIHEVIETEAQAFFLHVLRSEGRLENLIQPKPILLRSWRTVLESVKAHYRHH